MAEPYRKAVLVKDFVDYNSDPDEAGDWYNEIWENSTTDFDGDWATSTNGEGRYLVHPDSDNVKVESGAIVILEEVPNHYCERWKEDALEDEGQMVNSVWRIVTDG